MLEDEIPPQVRLDGTISNWVRALPAEDWRDLQLRAIERVEVEVKKGPSNVTDRLMVRGLAALAADLTGVVPKRTYRRPNAAGGPVGEVYWFRDLATKLDTSKNLVIGSGS